MAYLLIFLAVIALAAGIWLWNVDARERRAQSAEAFPAEASATAEGPTLEEEPAAEPEPSVAEVEELEEPLVDPTSTAAPEPAALASVVQTPPSEDATTPGLEPVPDDVAEPLVEEQGGEAVEPVEQPEPAEPAESIEQPEPAGPVEAPVEAGSTVWYAPLADPEQPSIPVADEISYVLDTEPDVHGTDPVEGEFELDTAGLPDPAASADSAAVAEPAAEHEPEAEPAAEEPAVEQKPAQRPTPQPWQHRRSGLQLPGASRRERRSWAEAKGFAFAKQDDFLNGEWQRGAAATGAPARDIASGNVYGHDTHLMDLGSATVLAMATGEVSDIVVDMRRATYAAHFTAASSEDLVEVASEEGFTVYATEAGPVQRFIDIRVRTALNELPPAVIAVWFEGEWVLAQFAGNGHSTPAEWDAALAPLALLADAARTLPPANPRPLNTDAITPDTPEPFTAQPALAAADEMSVDKPKVQRPEEPLEMPTRTTGAVRGPVELRALGGDEVEAIADGPAQETTRDLTRARRTQTPPSIFQDATAEATTQKENDDE